jgi:hypothetical protein
LGVGYIEHFSIGAGVSFNDRHAITAHYGSNAFIKTKEFSSILLEYDFAFKNLTRCGLIPMIGLKGGHAVYTDAGLSQRSSRWWE